MLTCAICVSYPSHSGGPHGGTRRFERPIQIRQIANRDVRSRGTPVPHRARAIDWFGHAAEFHERLLPVGLFFICDRGQESMSAISGTGWKQPLELRVSDVSGSLANQERPYGCENFRRAERTVVRRKWNCLE